MARPKIERVMVDAIEVHPRLRAINDDAVKVMMESMADLGLQTPITVRWTADSECVLVAGATRLEAAKRLGWKHIDTTPFEGSEVSARLWEIAENLHRSELTVADRAEHIAEWVRLTEVVSGQVAQKPQGGRPEGGVSAASRELGVERTEVRRAVKIASLSPEAKAAAKEAGLDDNQSALLAAAKRPAEEQAAEVRRIAAQKAVKLAPDPRNDFEAKEAQVSRLMSAWNAAGKEAREEFLARIDRPVFDSTRAA